MLPRFARGKFSPKNGVKYDNKEAYDIVHKLSEAIREAFCEVYEQDVLTNWAMEMKQMLSEKNAKKFPHIPERGNLDLSLVKQSTCLLYTSPSPRD